MAGIWERVKPNILNRMNGHAFDAIYTLYVTGEKTRPQLVAALQDIVDPDLDQDSLDDLAAIADEMGLMRIEEIKKA